MVSRRHFIQHIFVLFGALFFKGRAEPLYAIQRKKNMKTQTTVYRSINGTPSENMEKVLDLIGGIETIIDKNDIIIIKPNLQWWNQGAPNIAAIVTLINHIINRTSGFSGEVIIAENNHSGPMPWETEGWIKKFERNSNLPNIHNYNDLSKFLKEKHGDKFSICHWIDIRSGSRRVYSAADGTGYVLCDGTGDVPLLSMNNGLQENNRREVIMSYPIFKTDNGTIVDFKNGVWKNGAYTDQPVKFINCAALNHHSSFCGATSAVKNHLGISDLSGGSNPEKGGKLTGNYFNFHSFPFNWTKPGPVPGMLGAEIGMFFNTIRKPDLNITTTEYIGIVSRTELPVAQTRAVLASKDPVALDYHATKYLLYPNSQIPLHNPDNKNGPLYSDLRECARRANLIFDENYVDVISYDFNKNGLQNDNELIIKSEINWGHNIKMLLKYLLFRFGIV